MTMDQYNDFTAIRNCRVASYTFSYNHGTIVYCQSTARESKVMSYAV